MSTWKCSFLCVFQFQPIKTVNQINKKKLNGVENTYIKIWGTMRRQTPKLYYNTSNATQILRFGTLYSERALKGLIEKRGELQMGGSALIDPASSVVALYFVAAP